MHVRGTYVYAGARGTYVYAGARGTYVYAGARHYSRSTGVANIEACSGHSPAFEIIPITPLNEYFNATDVVL